MGHRLSLVSTLTGDEIERITKFEEPNPSSILGPKIERVDGNEVASVRAYLPRASKAWVLTTDGKEEMTEIGGSHLFRAYLGSGLPFSKYSISFVDNAGFVEEREDPYSFPPVISEYDLYLINEGTHRRSYERLGAHCITVEGIGGVHFAVWAPNARSVSVVGDFNHWKAGAHPMNVRGTSGVWELFVPRLRPSEVYKFAIKTKGDGSVLIKTDPYAFQCELRPNTAAVVADLDYSWEDDEWMEGGSRVSPLGGAMSTYEVHLGSWKRKDGSAYLSYRELADELVPYVEKLGFTHIELLPVMEHPLDDSWGYQIVNFFAPTSRFGKPSDLMYFIDRCHQRGIGVILDWVPGHFPKDDHGLSLFDGTHLYDHADPRKGQHPEWGTLIFNYSRNEVRTFLVSNAIFWLEKYHVDGLRLDAVASMLYLDYARRPGEWTPNIYGGRENLEAVSFLREINDLIHERFPKAITEAEESTAWQGVTAPAQKGGLGFDLKWNMGWMHDTLDYFSKDPIHRKYHQSLLTFSLWYAFSERFVLVLSHDEVVYGKRSMLNKMPGDAWQKFANLRLCYGYMFMHPGKKHLFMGGEFGQWNEWDFRRGLDWHLAGQPMHSGISLYLRDLNMIYRGMKELHELDLTGDGFEWIDFHDSEQSVISFVRRAKDGRELLAVFNMTPVPRLGYRVGVPRPGFLKEILNSDATVYGGSGMGNLGGVKVEPTPWNGRDNSASLTLPPLGMVVFSLDEGR